MSLMRKALCATVLLLTLWAVPAVTCTVAHVPQSTWAASLANWAGTDEKAMQDAIRLVAAGDSTLALARIDAHAPAKCPRFMAFRHATAYIFLELAHGAGALPDAATLTDRDA